MLVLLTCVQCLQYSDSDVRSLWSRLKPKIPEFFKDVDVKPSLLHGDLWSGNVAETDDGPGTVSALPTPTLMEGVGIVITALKSIPKSPKT